MIFSELNGVDTLLVSVHLQIDIDWRNSLKLDFDSVLLKKVGIRIKRQRIKDEE